MGLRPGTGLLNWVLSSLALDDSDVETVKRNLKAAEGKGDSALVARWTERLKQLEPPEGAVTAESTVRITVHR